MSPSPDEIASKVVENLRGSPLVLALLIINLVALLGFTYTLYQIGYAVERRDKILERCIK
jgi:hypothetical protein